MYFDGSYKLNSSCTIHQHLSEALFAYNGTHFLGVGAEQDWRLLILHADARKIPFRVIWRRLAGSIYALVVTVLVQTRISRLRTKIQNMMCMESHWNSLLCKCSGDAMPGNQVSIGSKETVCSSAPNCRGISNKPPPSAKPRPNFDYEIFENIKIPREIRILAAAGEKILTFQTLCKLDL